MSYSKRWTILATTSALTALFVVQAWAAGKGGDPKKGKKMFETTCATCHGVKGLGDGPAGMALTPKARNFANDKFKFGSTVANLTHTIETGSPGTAMVGWKGTLKPDQIADVVAYVRTLIPKKNLDKPPAK